MSQRVVITGLGLVCPLGTGVEKSWSGFTEGRSGIRAISRFDPAGFDTQIAGEVPDFKPEDWFDKKEARHLDPFAQFALAACEMAMKESGLVISPANADRVACIIGSGIGGITTLEEQHIRLREKGPSRVSPFFVPMTLINLAAGHASIRFGIRGPNFGPVSACATGAHSIGEAMRMIQRGECDAALAGGAEAPITPLTIAGFNALKAMCEDRNQTPERASRPFERDRSGFVPAEGAAILVLESLDHAAARGAKVLAELAGYAANSDAHHITAPSPGGEGAARCMRAALRDARLAPSAIGYINAHGTSTPYNDVAETQAIKTTFGEAARHIPVSSIKSMVGHSLGAAGAMEVVVSALALTRGVLPPTINYENPDPECDLDYVPNKARAAVVDAVVSNSFGFGGTNAVLVLRRFA
jgi:3-oxoacyl-[acyl-carrier-protein] synthase II